jgi:hypothetical protein
VTPVRPAVMHSPVTSPGRKDGKIMKKCDKDTLANLIFGELRRLNRIWKECIGNGDTQTAKIFREQIKALEQLNSVIWQELK